VRCISVPKAADVVAGEGDEAYWALWLTCCCTMAAVMECSDDDEHQVLNSSLAHVSFNGLNSGWVQ
jgi:hypothetical protein